MKNKLIKNRIVGECMVRIFKKLMGERESVCMSVCLFVCAMARKAPRGWI
jgi:hypothetical protein